MLNWFAPFACQVTRPTADLELSSLYSTSALVLGRCVQEFAFPAFRFGYTPTRVPAPVWRKVVKNQTLSRFNGPPTAGLMSQIRLIWFGAARPRVFRSSLKLLPCIPVLAKAPVNEPCTSLPPSAGIMFMRTPPVDTVASPDDVSTVISEYWAMLATPCGAGPV